MELPHLGNQCKFPECKQLDFLPAKCVYCDIIFCGQHLSPSYHLCDKVVENKIENISKSGTLYKCTYEKCKTTDSVEMTCIKCHNHFCLQHRYHSCFDLTPSQARREKERAPKEQFKKAKESSDKIVENKLKNAKNRALANKIKLMRVKGFAVGENSIPVSQRLFFCVCPPLVDRASSESRPLFVSSTWTVGRCVDSLAKRLKLSNNNLEIKSDKLRLFTTDGTMLGPGQDIPIGSLLDDGTLVDGDNLILEYIPQNQLDEGIYTLSNFSTNQDKYIWTK